MRRYAALRDFALLFIVLYVGGSGLLAMLGLYLSATLNRVVHLPFHLAADQLALGLGALCVALAALIQLSTHKPRADPGLTTYLMQEPSADLALQRFRNEQRRAKHRSLPEMPVLTQMYDFPKHRSPQDVA